MIEVRTLRLAALAVSLAAALAFPARAEEETTRGGVAFEPGTPAFSDVLAKAKAQSKPVFIDFSTEWCGWCKRLDKDTFSRPEVGEAMTAFVNVHVDAEKGEGVSLAKKYGVTGFPTLVVVDAAGDEVDRIVGYLKPEPFVKEVKRILSGEGTLPALKAKAEANPDDVDAGVAYASKVFVTKPEDALARFEGMAAKVHDKDRPAEARVWLAFASLAGEAGKHEPAMAAAERILRDFADTPAAGEVGVKAGRAFLRADPRRALTFFETASNATKDGAARARLATWSVAVHREAMADALAKAAADAGDDAQLLNEIAWACHEQHVNVRDAVGWAKRAVELSNREPAVLDTLANLLWDVGQREEAIRTEVEAADGADGMMRAEFLGTVAKWRTMRDLAEEEKWRAQRKASASDGAK